MTCAPGQEYTTQEVIIKSKGKDEILWAKTTVDWTGLTFDRSKTPTRLLIDVRCQKMKPGAYRDRITLQVWDGLRFVDTAQGVNITATVQPKRR